MRSDALLAVKANCQRLVLDSLIPFYRSLPDGARVEQVGTGILIQRATAHVVLTAKHVLFGERDDKDPGETGMVIGGKLRQLGGPPETLLWKDPLNDLVGFVANGFAAARGLAEAMLVADPNAKFVTIAGYLARDFKRSTKEGILMPAPFVYSNQTIPMEGKVAMRYPKSRNRNTATGLKGMVPRPAGLSGGPMLDSEALLGGQIRVLGVFTDQPNDRGIAYGEPAATALRLLNAIPAPEDRGPTSSGFGLPTHKT